MQQKLDFVLVFRTLRTSIDLITVMNKSVDTTMPLLPALSSVLQVVRASHSRASIAEAVAVSRTYFD